MAAELSNTPAGLQEAKTAVHIDLEACYLGLQEWINPQLVKKEGFIISPPLSVSKRPHHMFS